MNITSEEFESYMMLCCFLVATLIGISVWMLVVVVMNW